MSVLDPAVHLIAGLLPFVLSLLALVTAIVVLRSVKGTLEYRIQRLERRFNAIDRDITRTKQGGNESEILSRNPVQLVDGLADRVRSLEERLKSVTDYLEEQHRLNSHIGKLETAEPVGEPPKVAEIYKGAPVEIRGDEIIASQALSPVGFVKGRQGETGTAEVHLNPDVEIDHVTFKQWGKFFDFGGGEPYSKYRTMTPSIVSWDPRAGRGRLVERGAAKEIREF